MTDSALTNKTDKNLFLKKLSRELTIKKNPFDADYKELRGEKIPTLMVHIHQMFFLENSCLPGLRMMEYRITILT